jgi:L,D-transpeptidase ErfK/SrfK
MVMSHPIGIGREGWATPIGKAAVVAKSKHPSWVVPPSVRAEHAREGDPLPPVVPPGPDNPLGDYALRLDLPSYLIHGTNKPYGVGMRVSHGCVRLYPEDIASLFPTVPVGTPVRIVNLPYLAGWRADQLYLEAHPPLEEQAKRWGNNLKPMRVVVRRAAGASAEVDWAKAKRVAQEARGFPVPVSPGSPDAAALIASAPVVRQPAQRAAASSDLKAGGRWYVQVGSFRYAGNARRAAAMLEHLGPPVPARTVSRQGGFRVVAGPYPSRAAARAEERRIREALGTDTVVTGPRDI